MLHTKEFRLGDMNNAIVVLTVDDESRQLTVLVNGETVVSEELRDEVTVESVIEDFTENEAYGAVLMLEEKHFFDTNPEYAISKTHDFAGYSITACAESEGSDRVAYIMRDSGGNVVSRAVRTINVAKHGQLAGEVVNAFDDKVARSALLKLMVTGRL